jgi:hypothetical protein
VRKNYLRRLVSTCISRQLDYWIGPPEEFHRRLKSTQLKPLDPRILLAQIQRDRDAVEKLLTSVSSVGSDAMKLFYESIFPRTFDAERSCEIANSVITFLGWSPFSREALDNDVTPLLEPETNQWSSEQVYCRIPNISEIEAKVGCEETGFLLK